jgi:hypothetical protein
LRQRVGQPDDIRTHVVEVKERGIKVRGAREVGVAEQLGVPFSVVRIPAGAATIQHLSGEARRIVRPLAARSKRHRADSTRTTRVGAHRRA